MASNILNMSVWSLDGSYLNKSEIEQDLIDGNWFSYNGYQNSVNSIGVSTTTPHIGTSIKVEQDDTLEGSAVLFSAYERESYNLAGDAARSFFGTMATALHLVTNNIKIPYIEYAYTDNTTVDALALVAYVKGIDYVLELGTQYLTVSGNREGINDITKIANHFTELFGNDPQYLKISNAESNDLIAFFSLNVEVSDEMLGKLFERSVGA